MKKLALILAFVMCFSSTLFFGGCNTITQDSTITQEDNSLNNSENVEQLANIQTEKDKDGITWHLVYNKEDLKSVFTGGSVNIKLCANIDLGGDSWTPVEYSYATFDGQGYSISNFIVSEENYYGGLFSSLLQANIKDLTIQNAKIKGSLFIGGIAGAAQRSKIINCSVVNSTIAGCYTSATTSGESGTIFVGGIVGNTIDGTLSNCMNLNTTVLAVTLYDTNLISTNNKAYVGGISGASREHGSDNGKIENCLSSGQVLVANKSANDEFIRTFGSAYQLVNKFIRVEVGGIVGKNFFSNISYNGYEINNCYNTGTIIAGHSNSYESDTTNFAVEESYAGGIAGVSTNTISNCLNEGNVTAVAQEKTSTAQIIYTKKGTGNIIYASYDKLYSSEYKISLGANSNIKLDADCTFGYNQKLYYHDYLKIMDNGNDFCRVNINLKLEGNRTYEMNAYSAGICPNVSNAIVKNSYSEGAIAGGYIRSYLLVNIYLYDNVTANNDNDGNTWRSIAGLKLYAMAIADNADKTNVFSGTVKTSKNVNIAATWEKDEYVEVTQDNIDSYNKVQDEITKIELNYYAGGLLSANLSKNDNKINVNYRIYYDVGNYGEYQGTYYETIGSLEYFEANIPSSSSNEYNYYTEAYIGSDFDVQKLNYATKYFSNYTDEQKQLIFTELVLNNNYTNKNNTTWVLQDDKIYLDVFGWSSSYSSTNPTCFTVENNFIYFGDSSNKYRVLYGTTKSKDEEISANDITNAIRPTTVAVGAYSFCDYNITGDLDLSLQTSLQHISMCAFAETGITSVTIPASVTNIENRAFNACTGLTTVDVVENSVLQKIGKNAFAECSALATVALPCAKLTNIDKTVFNGCASISDITLGCDIDLLEQMTSDNSFDTVLSKITLTDTATGTIKCKKVTYTAKGNIVQGVFHRFTNLQELTIERIDDIEDKAFEENDKLKKLTTSIDPAMFSNTGLNDKIVNLTINYDTVRSISRCFSNVQDVYIGANVTEISSFKDHKNLKKIIFDDKAKLTTIGENAFYNCDKLESITIPNNVTSIGKQAFYDCGALTSITISESVTSIGESAFYNCDKLKSIGTLPNSLKTIGQKAFYGCDVLESINLPKTLEEIGSEAFYKCDKLKTVSISCKLDIVDFVDLNHLEKLTITNECPSTTFSSSNICSDIKTVTLGNNIQTLGDGLFKNKDSLTSVTFGSGLKTIGKMTFYDCDALTSITIPSSITSIGESAFEGCDGIASIAFPNSVLEIGYKAFFDCDKIESVEIPSGVTFKLKSRKSYAFASCSALNTILIKAAEPSAEWDELLNDKKWKNLLNNKNWDELLDDDVWAKKLKKDADAWEEVLNDANGDGNNDWNYQIEFINENIIEDLRIYEESVQWDKVTRYIYWDVKWTRLRK